MTTSIFQMQAQAEQVIMQLASKCAFVAVRTVYRKSPTPEIINLYNGLACYSKGVYYTDTMPDAVADIVQVAAEVVTKAFHDLPGATYGNNVHFSLDDFINTFYAENWHTQACSAVNCYMYAQQPNKGMKQITQKVAVPVYDCIVTHGKGKGDIYTAKEEYTYSHAYPVSLVSLEATIIKPPDFHRVAYKSDNILKRDSILGARYDMNIIDLEDNTLEVIERIVNERDMEVINYLADGYKAVEIAEMLGVTKQMINTIRSRIKRKIAKSGMFANSPHIKAYHAKSTKGEQLQAAKAARALVRERCKNPTATMIEAR